MRFGFSGHCASPSSARNEFRTSARAQENRERGSRTEGQPLTGHERDLHIRCQPVRLVSNKRQGHSHWRAVCSMSSLRSSLVAQQFSFALCSLILRVSCRRRVLQRRSVIVHRLDRPVSEFVSLCSMVNHVTIVRFLPGLT